MKIAIIADVHENEFNLKLVLEKLKKLKVEEIICLGDMINPAMYKILSDFEIPTFSIWGNNDGEKVKILRFSLEENSNLTMGEKIYDFLEIDDRKIFLTHFDDIAEAMAKSGEYDAVFYGHNHMKDKRMIEKCLLLNPGELAAQKYDKASFAVYDTVANNAELYDLGDAFVYKK
jgi:putative phosphoesterase